MRSPVLVAATALLVAGCGPVTAGPDQPPPAPTSSPADTATGKPASPTPSVPGQRAQVVDVVDGDTVKVRTAAGTALTIRVLGIDTPEVYGGTECWGPEASQFAQQTLAGQTVGLVVDSTQDERDRYGRALRYLVLPDGGNYSVLAAGAGAARSYVYDTPVSEHEAIVAAEQRARDANRGLWGPPCYGAEQTAEPAPPPPEPEPEPASDCEPGYDPCVPTYPPDLDCSDVDGPIRVTGSDPHGLDGNDDGTGCE
jgi:micrococcal nuclease